MLDPSPEKLLVVGFIAFLVLGPDRLPQAARTLGRYVAHLRRMSSGFQTEVRDALGEPADALQSAIGEWRGGGVRRAVRNTVASTLAPRPDAPAGRDVPSAGSAAPVTGKGSVSGNGASAITPGNEERSSFGGSVPLPDDPSLN